ncbi:MAG: DUF167 domain-containing protein [Thermoproteota archaeon]
MRIVKVRVVPNARENRVTEEGSGLKVYVRAPPVEGKANRIVVELLADYFKVRRSAVRIARGGASRDKVFEINMGEDC